MENSQPKPKKETAQFNIEVLKETKKKFVSFCVEHDLILKDAGEMALLEFMKNYNAKNNAE